MKPFRMMPFRLLAVASLVWFCLVGQAKAHPHVFIDAKVELLFADDGRLIAVKDTWLFDKAFSAYAVLGLDKDKDGKFGEEELKELAQDTFDALREYDFFTAVRIDGKTTELGLPSEYHMESRAGRLSLTFSLPLGQPQRLRGKTAVEISDRNYFVAFTSTSDGLILNDAPAGCSYTFFPPRPLDPKIMFQLLSVPADQRDLPPELAPYASALGNVFVVSCR